MALVTVQGLTKIFGHRLHPVRALNGLSFAVEKGEFVGIMGPSGAGKTTLLSIISTIDVPTHGTVTVANTNVTRLRGDKLAEFRRANLGYVFQDFNLLSGMTVRENILLPLSIARQGVADAQDRLAAVLTVTGLTSLAERYPQELSIGQQQRVAVARALITQPTLVFADEPTGSLDSKAATELLRYLTTINQQWHTTIMMATHDAFTASYCSRVIFIKDGTLFAEIRRSGDRQAFFDAIIDMQATIGGGGIGMTWRTKSKIIGRVLHHNVLFWLATVFLVAVFYIMMCCYAVAANWTATSQNVFLVAAVTNALFFMAFFYYGQRYIIGQYRQEIALYQLWGVPRRQLYGTILTLNLIVLGLMVTAGLAFGALFMPLAVLLLQRFMGLATQFVAPWQGAALVRTLATFAAIGLLSQLVLVRQVYRVRPVQLLHGKKADTLHGRHRLSLAAGVYGVLATVSGLIIAQHFWWLWLIRPDTTGLRLLGLLSAILILVISGEHALIHTTIPLLLMGLRRLPRWPLKRNRLLKLARLTRQFRGEATVLWIGAILLSIVVTWAGMLTTTISVANREAANQARMTFVTHNPRAWQDLDKALTRFSISDVQRVQSTFKIRVVQFRLVNHQTGQAQAVRNTVAIMSQAEYRRVQRMQNLPELPRLTGRAVMIGDALSNTAWSLYRPNITLHLNQKGLPPLRRVGFLTATPYATTFNTAYATDMVMVVSDTLWPQIKPEATITWYGGQATKPLTVTQIDRLLATMPSKYRNAAYFSEKGKVVTRHYTDSRDQTLWTAPKIRQTFRRETGIDVFVGCVLSVVILFAVNSMLTLRAWAEREEGVGLFFSLGMTADEIRHVQNDALAWRYALPVIMAALNGLFALQMLWTVAWTAESAALFLLVLGAVALVSWLFFMLSAQLVRRSIVSR